MPDARLTEARLRAALGARPFRYFAQIGSTNDVARAWAADGAISGSVVIADEQISGRGRFARRWQAEPGTALLFSLILRPSITPENVPRLAMVGALAVVDCLDTAVIKWPNDVLWAGRKVAGILVEADWQADHLNAVVLGIGLNVRGTFDGTPLAETAVSMETITGRAVDRAELLGRLVRRVDFWLTRLDTPMLFETWRSRLITLGQHVTARSITDGASQSISGKAVGVEPSGALLLEEDNGTIQRVMAGEVTLSGTGLDER